MEVPIIKLRSRFVKRNVNDMKKNSVTVSIWFRLIFLKIEPYGSPYKKVNVEVNNNMSLFRKNPITIDKPKKKYSVMKIPKTAPIIIPTVKYE